MYKYIYLQASASAADLSKSRLGMTFVGPGSPEVLPVSLLWHLECIGDARKTKVGYLALLCRREH